MNPLMFRLIATIFLIFSMVINSKVIFSDYKVSQVLRYNQVNKTAIENILSEIEYYAMVEPVVVGYYKENKRDCENNIKFAKILLDMNTKSSQAYYILASCYDQNGDLISAQAAVENSLLIDPHNVVNLLNLAIIQYKFEKYLECQKTLDKINFIRPNLPNTTTIQNLLNKVS